MKRRQLTEILGVEHPSYGNDPTVDDMLTWLRNKGHHVHSKAAPAPATAVRVHVSGFHGPFVAGTLHAALEAAVRAVHDAEEAK